MFQKIKQSFFFWLARRLPPCDVIIKQLSESMDHTLPLRQRIIIRLHLLTCVLCVRYGEQIQFVRKVVRTGGQLDDAVSGDRQRHLSSAARDRMSKRLKEGQ